MTTCSLPPDHAARMERVRLALDGLSVGDAFGEHFFFAESLRGAVAERWLPDPPWEYTDDTVMALGIAEVLDRHGGIEKDELARVFARNYRKDPMRGYGGMAHTILQAILWGVPWREATDTAFDGQGSMGNGGAMRVAPVAAYFADDVERAVAEARASARVTHAHREGKAGAMAVAAAAAWAWQTSAAPADRAEGELLRVAWWFTPAGDTRDGLRRALALPRTSSVADAVNALGTTVSGAGDIDTNAAIVGGVVALANGRRAIPREWLEAREPLTF
jgi:ADP-ribosylglycohydrolase